MSTEDLEEGSFQNILYGDAYKLYEQGTTVMDNEHAEVPFPPLDGERILYIGLLCDQDRSPTIVLSNYRFFVAFPEAFYNVPLGLIDSVEIKAPSNMILHCFNAQAYIVLFYSEEICYRWKERLHEVLESGKVITDLFAFKHQAEVVDKVNTTPEKSRGESQLTGTRGMLCSGHRPDPHETVSMEFERLRMKNSGQWRISECNADFKFCPSYPKLLIVPKSVSDEDLEEVAKFRVNGRIPAVVWRHENGCVLARSSQPRVGWFSYRSVHDEHLLFELSQSCQWAASTPAISTVSVESSPHERAPDLPLLSGQPKPSGQVQQKGVLQSPGSTQSSTQLSAAGKSGPVVASEQKPQKKLLVFDLRAYMACLGNRAKGGGTENPDFYTNCIVQYKGLANIYDVYKTFSDLRALLAIQQSPNFLSSLENTKWLLYLSQVLSVSMEVVSALDKEGLPVLVHCSDGWDRTPQVVSLAKLILDPHYRTIEGFRFLIEREWLSFSHQFEKRCNFAYPEKKSPVFLQWLDCVHQLLNQFPCDFEFNEDLLLFLGNHCYSNLYGTFTGESEKDRVDCNVYSRTKSVWTAVEENEMKFINFVYSKPFGRKTLQAQTDVKHLLLWKRMFMLNTCNRLRLSPRNSPFDPCFSTASETVSPTDRHRLASWSAQVVSNDGGIEEAPQTMEMSRLQSKVKRSKVNVIIGSLENTDSILTADALASVRPLKMNQDYVSSVRPLLGDDGFVHNANPVHVRLQHLLREHKTEVTHLNQRVHELQEEKRVARDRLEDSPVTMNSWEEVSATEETVKWVPDHAVYSCMNCNTVFTFLKRKHHCRKCGGVFCYDCAHNYVPVESELLNKPVRVCENCFDKLDGHLRRDNSMMDDDSTSNKNATLAS